MRNRLAYLCTLNSTKNTVTETKLEGNTQNPKITR